MSVKSLYEILQAMAAGTYTAPDLAREFRQFPVAQHSDAVDAAGLSLQMMGRSMRQASKAANFGFPSYEPCRLKRYVYRMANGDREEWLA